MPTVTIDGQEYEFEEGDAAIQHCLDHGIEIPHFCFHPGMSVPGNCRQCLVKAGTPERDDEGNIKTDEHGNPIIRYMPKLQISCDLGLSDGMVIKTHRTSQEVREAQEDNLEFLLINHPLDCPICDQAGECPLQNQAYKYGPEGSRFEFEKVHKPKHVRLGPNVVLDAERCVNCTRCTRFTEEVSGSHQLSIISRGATNYPMTAPGEEFDDPYSMNTIDICPVGALTSEDFRFKARVWEMSSTPSITVDCSKGSNCHYWVRDNRIERVTARTNLQVNDYWLPDAERLSYDRFNENRPKGPQMRTSDGELVRVEWDRAYRQAADVLGARTGGAVQFLGSAHANVETNYLLRQLAEQVGADTPEYISHVEPGSGDGWLITDDKAPNANGCQRLGMNPVDEPQYRRKIRSGEVEVLYVVEEDPVANGLVEPEDLEEVWVILHPYNTTNQTLPYADIVLPAAMVVETIGTYVNIDGVAQRVRPAKEIKQFSRALMSEMSASRIDREGTPFDRWYNEENIVNCVSTWDALQEIAELMEIDLSYEKPAEIMDELAGRESAFNGATYEEMGLHGVQLEEIGEPA
jgi:NADH-quinone oxidoreductase subunit G